MYGRPPRKSRAGLIIALMLVLLIGVLGVGGVLGYRLVSDKISSTPDPGSTPTAAPVSSPTPERSIPASQPPKTTRPPATKPPTTKPTAAKPAGTIAELTSRFVAQLNANNRAGAAALACASAKQLIPTLMDVQLKPPVNLTTTGPLIGQQTTFMVRLTGTVNGTPATGILVLQQLNPEPLCIRAFQITPG